MSELKVTGTITRIEDVQTGTSSNGEWAKIGFVVQTEGEYPKDVYFTIFGAEKVDKFKRFNKVNNRVEVSFDPSSREYNDKWYTDLNAWRVWGLDRNQGDNSAPEPDSPEEEDDDLPFGNGN